MLRFLNIVRENDATFYDFRTGRRRNTAPRLICTLGISGVLAIVFTGDVATFLSSLITVQAVLVGFAFSVIFFLLSVPETKALNPDSIEDQLAARKAETLSNELFSNVSYFTLVGMIGLSAAIALLAPDLPSFLLQTSRRLQLNGSSAAAETASKAGRIALLFATSFLTIESGYTFGRTIGRVWFLFTERARLSGRQSSRS